MLLRRYYPIFANETVRHMPRSRKALYRLFESDCEPVNQETPLFNGAFPIELTETTDAYHLQALLPGIDAEHMDIQADNDTLTLSVNWETPCEANTCTEEACSTDELSKKREQSQEPFVHIREFRYGKMERTLQFAHPIVTEQIEAQVKNGVLSLTIPKENIDKKRSIKVNVH